MAQATAIVRGTLVSAAGSTDFTSSGFGTPTAAIVIVCDANTTNNPQDGAGISIGFWDGTEQRVIHAGVVDGLADSSAFRSSNDALIAMGGSDTLSTWSASAITDGIRLTLVTDNTTVARYCTVLLFSGINAKVVTITTNATQDATVDSASLGFAPKMAFFTTVGAGGPDITASTTTILSLGVAANNGTHRLLTWGATNAQAVESLSAFFSETRCVGQVAGTITWTGEVTTWGADTLTLTTRDGGSATDVCFALILGGADFSFDCGTINTPTTTGTQIQGLRVQPTAVLTASSLLTVAGTPKADSEANAFALGLADATNEYSHNVFAEDAASTTNTGSVATATKMIDVDSSVAGARTDVIDGTVDFGWNSFNINYTAVTTARKGFWVAFGPAAVSYAVSRKRNHLSAENDIVNVRRRRLYTGTAAPVSNFSGLALRHKYRFPQENDIVPKPRRRHLTSLAPDGISFELPLFKINKDYDIPHFAKDAAYELPLYEVPLGFIAPRAAFDYNFVLPSYEIQYGYNLPVQGLAFTLPLWEVECALLGMSYLNDVSLTLGLYEIEVGRFTPELAVDRFVELGFYEVPYGYHLPVNVTLNPSATKKYVESIWTDAQTLMGITAGFKIDPSAGSMRTDSQIVHLAKAKVTLSSGNHAFILETPTPLAAGQFVYRSMDRLLVITNPTDWQLLIILDPVSGGDDEAIQVVSRPGYTMPIASW